MIAPHNCPTLNNLHQSSHSCDQILDALNASRYKLILQLSNTPNRSSDYDSLCAGRLSLLFLYACTKGVERWPSRKSL